MESTHYLIVGSSHAALEAVNAIRMHDADGAVTMVTADTHLPYSPTLLPYIVSGRSVPERAPLRDEAFFERQKVRFVRGNGVAALSPRDKRARLADGTEIAYDKALLATGAAPLRPRIPGLDGVRHHVLRTLDDAIGLRQAIATARRAVVLGGGLVGMHAAENLVEAGAQVTVVELGPRVLGAYFDATASGFIERAFREHGATVLTGTRAVGVEPFGDGARVALSDGRTLDADLLLVAAGVRPRTEYLAGAGVDVADGILVDDTMRTSASDVWAAGDCAQARDFFGASKIVNAIVPTAAEQGRIAGAAMAGDLGVKPFAGAVPLNTYRFFGHHALSVGSTREADGVEIDSRVDEANGRALKIAYEGGALRGIAGIDVFFDAGVMWQLVLRRIDVTGVRWRLLADPAATGRELMSKHWR